jgi:hypothetical protein
VLVHGQAADRLQQMSKDMDATAREHHPLCRARRSGSANAAADVCDCQSSGARSSGSTRELQRQRRWCVVRADVAGIYERPGSACPVSQELLRFSEAKLRLLPFGMRLATCASIAH